MEKDLKNQIFHWWKIIDRPSINQDELINFVSFELFLSTLEKTKEMIKQSLEQGLLILNQTSEEISLGPELKKVYAAWQKLGDEKVASMQKAIKKKWRPRFKLSHNDLFQVYLNDLADVMIIQEANKLRASRVKIDNDLETITEVGLILLGKGVEDGVDYPFIINLKKQTLIHNCPDFIVHRRDNSQLCKHMVRVFQKLYSKKSALAIKVLKNISLEKEKWVFSSDER